MPEAKKVLSSEDIDRILYRLANQILEKNSPPSSLVLIGIQTRGVFLAKRIRAIVKEIKNIDLPLGIIDITLYRDDLTAIGPNPIVKETKISFDVNNKTIVLIDDVLFTGRTVRAALSELMDFGRPISIQLLILIDRGHRELPIRADFVGKNLPTSRQELVEVKLRETDGSDEVTVVEREKSNGP